VQAKIDKQNKKLIWINYFTTDTREQQAGMVVLNDGCSLNTLDTSPTWRDDLIRRLKDASSPAGRTEPTFVFHCNRFY